MTNRVDIPPGFDSERSDSMTKRYPTRIHEILTKPGEPPLKSGEMFALNTDPDDMDYYLTDDGDMFLRYGTANKTVRMAHADEVIDAIIHGITRRPRLTEEQILALNAAVKWFGFKWLVKDKCESVCFWQNKPEKRENHWSAYGGGMYTDIMTVKVDNLVSWSDPEPLDIVQTLRDAGRLEGGGMTDWISIKDRLPEVWQDVLLVCNGKVYEGCMMNDGDFENARGYDLTNVTHWMPLPEPPGEEGKE